MNQLSIMSFGLIVVSLALFASESQAGLLNCMCGKSSGEGSSSLLVARPPITRDLLFLSDLNDHLVAVDPNVSTRDTEITSESLVGCVVRYMRSQCELGIENEELNSLVNGKITKGCKNLNTLLRVWYAEVESQSPASQSDPWFFTMKICKAILDQNERLFLNRAFRHLAGSNVSGR